MRTTLIAAALAMIAAAPAFAQQSLRAGADNTLVSDARAAAQTVSAQGRNAVATGNVGSMSAGGPAQMGSNNVVALQARAGTQTVLAKTNATAVSSIGSVSAANGIKMGSGNVISTNGRVGTSTVTAAGGRSSASGNVGSFSFR